MKNPLSTGFFLFIIILPALLTGCSKQVSQQTQVYLNDFQDQQLQGISGGTISRFGSTQLLGGFQSSGFSLQLTDLPAHDLITISFDLYLHDDWKGNHRPGANPQQYTPDLWSLKVDGQLYIHTTFSNTPCVSTWFCPTQSYPANYPNNNQAAFKGAASKSLPGRCDPSGISSRYKITKTIAHNQATLLLECLDGLQLEAELEQTDCLPSWSIDNLSIQAISLK